jgi:UDP:flavonoid glycosyltransferase YjiC (YdhE family)
VDNEAGAAMPYQELSSSKIDAVAEQLINSSEIAENARRLENKLVSARGVNKILREMLKM